MIVGWFLLLAFLTLVGCNIRNIGTKTEKGSDALGCVFLGLIGTILVAAYMFGGGVQ